MHAHRIGDQREARTAGGGILGGLDDLQLGVIHPHGPVDIPHESRHTGARLGDTVDLQLVAVLFDLREIDAFRNGFDEFIEQVHDFRPLALQSFYDLHTRNQALLAVLEILNIRDLRVEFDDLLLQEIVLFDLCIGPTRIHQLAAENEYAGGEYSGASGDHEFSTPYFTLCFTPRK